MSEPDLGCYSSSLTGEWFGNGLMAGGASIRRWWRWKVPPELVFGSALSQSPCNGDGHAEGLELSLSLEVR